MSANHLQYYNCGASNLPILNRQRCYIVKRYMFLSTKHFANTTLIELVVWTRHADYVMRSYPSTTSKLNSRRNVFALKVDNWNVFLHSNNVDVCIALMSDTTLPISFTDPSSCCLFWSQPRHISLLWSQVPWIGFEFVSVILCLTILTICKIPGCHSIWGSLTDGHQGNMLVTSSAIRRWN